MLVSNGSPMVLTKSTVQRKLPAKYKCVKCLCLTINYISLWFDFLNIMDDVYSKRGEYVT